MSIENLIFSQLISNEEYARKILPHLKDEYFTEDSEKKFLKLYTHFFNKHNKVPSKPALLIEIENLKSSAEIYTSLKDIISRTEPFEESLAWLMEKTEEYCKEKAIFNALREAVLIVDGQSKSKGSESIPSILQAALAVCFDTSVGHDYLQDAEDRYDYYHMSEARIKSDITIYDKITKGGFPRKTLNVFLAPPHGGKSLVMVNIGAGALQSGSNVLYITMEMAAEEIGRRFDVNLMGIDFATLDVLPKQLFSSKFSKISSASKGRLMIKEYPTGGAHAGNFKALLADLKTKQNFVPDMIIVDYMSICSSEVYKAGNNQNSYTIVGSIGKELRALAIETNAAIITAVQTTRSGAGNSDVDISHTSECIYVNENVILRDGTSKKIADIVPGDQITSQDWYKTVQMVHHKKIKNCVKITTKSGKTIIVSRDHVFPSSGGRISVNLGLSVGDRLNTI